MTFPISATLSQGTNSFLVMAADMEGSIAKAKIEIVLAVDRGNCSGPFVAGGDYTNCDLTGADLFGANLTDASLTNALMVGAELYGAKWSNTTCPDGSVTTGSPC